MLKKFKPASLLPIGFAAAAAVAIIIACGNGEIITLDADKIADSRYNLENLIDHMDGESSNSGGGSSPSDGSSSSIGSSSSGGYSSSSGGSDGESSNSGGESSSSGGSSSSEAPPPLPSDLDCPSGSAPVTGAKCEWVPSPVISGDPAKVSTSPTEDCESKVFARISAGVSGQGTVSFVGDIVTTGTKEADDNPKVKFDWSRSDHVSSIKSRIACGTGATATCSLLNCSPTITEAPTPIKSGTMNCPWNYLTGYTNQKYLPISTTPLAACTGSITITNGGDDKAKCGAVSYEIDGSNSAASTVKGYAVATCRNKKYHLDSIVATVVDNPTLSTCAWTPEASKFYKGQQADAKATLSNSYGRCGTDGEKHLSNFPRPLNATDVGKSLTGTISVTTCTDGYGPLQAVCPASPTVGDGKIGGGVDTPFEPGNGGGNLPDANGLAELDGLLYMHGFGQNNQNTIRCTNTQDVSTYDVYYCDYWANSNCEPNNKCAENTSQASCALSISFHTTSTYTGNCGHGGALCEYKVKLKFILKNGSTTYPGSCKIGS